MNEHQNDLELAVVGNCTWGALIDSRARLVWGCLPRFDSDPMFCSLVDSERPDEGLFQIELIGLSKAEQHYERNTAILVTRLSDPQGNEIEVRDFAPRFENHGRMYRPTMLIREVRPVAGDPRIRIVLTPRCGRGSDVPRTTRGSNHLRFVAPELTLRLTTDAPISYVADATPFVLRHPVRLILGPDESLAGEIDATARDFYERTHDYWVEWARSLSIPFEWQEAVIRAAISLKLCHFEETGAIVAALTSSIPEAANSGRNWDYRFCWLRDAYFVIHVLNRLGDTRTMESYLGYIGNLVAGAQNGHLQPVYGVGLESALHEEEEPSLSGYRGMGPVRFGNQAWEHIQNDVYGSVVLAATQSFFDSRLIHPGGMQLYDLLEHVGEQALAKWNEPDAGLWELRGRSQIHTFSAAMCWAACDRLAKIAHETGLRERASHWRKSADHIRSEILDKAWNEQRGCLVDSFGGENVDASLLLLEALGFLPPDDPRFLGTLDAIERDLRRGDYVFRYATADDFGIPQNAFNICTFWYIDALSAVGRRDEARALFENMIERRNHAGLLSEDLDPRTGELWGNFPQTYSMVGLISSAMRLSRSWEDAL